MYKSFILDAAFSPFDMFIVALSDLWWIFAIAALLVISAVAGIIIFTKKKKDKENSK